VTGLKKKPSVGIIALMLLSLMLGLVSAPVMAFEKEPENLGWSGDVVIHRGYYTAPQNSLQSLIDARKNGYTMCEVDPRESSDGEIIMNHDETVVSDGREYTIARTDSEDLLSLNVGNDRYPGTTLCSLEQMLDVCRLSGMNLKIDQKVKEEELLKKVVAEVMDYGLQDQCIFTCANVHYGTVVKKVYDKAACSINYKKLYQDDSLDRYTAASPMYAEIPVSEIDEDSLEILAQEAERGYRIYVYDMSRQDVETAMLAHPACIEPASGEEKYDFPTLINDYAVEKYDDLDWN